MTTKTRKPVDNTILARIFGAYIGYYIMWEGHKYELRAVSATGVTALGVDKEIPYEDVVIVLYSLFDLSPGTIHELAMVMGVQPHLTDQIKDDIKRIFSTDDELDATVENAIFWNGLAIMQIAHVLTSHGYDIPQPYLNGGQTLQEARWAIYEKST